MWAIKKKSLILILCNSTIERAVYKDSDKLCLSHITIDDYITLCKSHILICNNS